MTKNEPMDLTGKVLIAMPGMGDPRFDRSVVLVCAHSPEGAMGLIINKRADSLHLTELLEQLSIPSGPETRDLPIHFGGPVETGRGFVLHDLGYRSSVSSMTIGDRFAMTATLDILEDFGAGNGPDKAILALGYAGWGPGQLEDELVQNAWLTTEADHGLIFDTPLPDQWEAALAQLGVSALTLSAEGGHA